MGGVPQDASTERYPSHPTFGWCWQQEPATTNNHSIAVRLRYEDQQRGSEHFPCYYMSYALTEDEVETMVEADLRMRRDASDDPDSVQPHSIEVIFEELESGDVPLQAALGNNSTFYTSADPEDWPDDVWATQIDARQALAQHVPQQQKVLFAEHVQGHTQREIAAALGVSQPRVAAILKAARKKFEEILSQGLSNESPAGPGCGRASQPDPAPRSFPWILKESPYEFSSNSSVHLPAARPGCGCESGEDTSA